MSAEAPAVVEVTHERLLKLLPRLLDPEIAATVRTTKRISAFAHIWRRALENGAELLAGLEGQAPDYRVRLWVRNANASCKFWFDVETRDRSVVKTPRYGHIVSLERVLEESEESTSYVAMWRRIVDAAKRGDPVAKRILQSVRAGVMLLLVLVVGCTALAISKPARDAVSHFIERARQAIEHAIHNGGRPAGSRIDVRPPQEPAVAATNITEIRDLAPISMSVKVNVGAEIPFPGPLGVADIYVLGFVHDEQDVSVQIQPSPSLNGIVGHVDVDFGDGTTAHHALSDPIGESSSAVVTHKYPHGDRGYMIVANIFEGSGAQARFVETIRRRVYIFSTTKADEPMIYHSPYGPHVWDLTSVGHFGEAPRPSIVVDLPSEERP